jgi:pantoate--beta-alanine ligase
VLAAAHEVLGAERAVGLDYLALVDPVHLRPVPEEYAGEALLAVAARVGTTRLIDNVMVTFGAAP